MKYIQLFLILLWSLMSGLAPSTAFAQSAQICGKSITQNPSKMSGDTPKSLGSATSTITVSGFSGKIADVNVYTLLTHTTSDVVMTLKSPAGTTVTLTSNNGWGIANVFHGTAWDDSADPGSGDALVTDCSYATGEVKSLLAPEEPLGSFYGENPNGQWKLSVSSTTGSGSLDRWVLNLSTISELPATLSSEFENGSAVPLANFMNGAVSTIDVAGLSGQIVRARVETDLIYNHCGYVSMYLISPGGRAVTLTSRNGGANANVYNGTLWTDTQNAGYATDFGYVNNTTATPLAPEEGLSSLMGEDPNGTWTLFVSHIADGSWGVLEGWKLLLESCDSGTPGVAAALQEKQFTLQNSPAFAVANVQMEAVLKNTGTQDVYVDAVWSDLQSQFGGAFLGVAELPQITGGQYTEAPVFNEQFDGIGEQNLVMPKTGLLKPGEWIRFTYGILMDPDAPNAVSLPLMQLNCEVEGAITGKMASDWSDSGNNPQGNNSGAPGDQGSQDDPTPVYAPILKTSMQLISACGNDTSATVGHTDAYFEIKLKNIGNAALDQIALDDKMKAEMGSLFFKARPGQHRFLPGCNAAQMPTFDMQFDGISNVKLFAGNNGKLLPGQSIVLQVYAELDNVNAVPTAQVYNRAEARARVLDQDGLALDMPGAAGVWMLNDWTDNGANPASTNPPTPLSLSGDDDKTPVPFFALIAGASDLSLELGQTIPDSWLSTGGMAQIAPVGCQNVSVENNYPDSTAWTAGDCGLTGVQHIVFTFKGDCANVCLQTGSDLILVDHTAPVFELSPSNLTVECGDNETIADWLGAQNAVDANDLVITHNYSAPVPLNEPVTVVFTATDACGNATTAAAVLMVFDQAPPTFAVSELPVYTIECGQTPVFDPAPEAADCSGVTITSADQTVQLGCIRQHVRIWTATDGAGNSTTLSQVILETDTQAPVLNVPYQTLELACGEQIPTDKPLVSDNCAADAQIQLTYTDNVSGNALHRVWVATDACGNTATAEQIFIYASDNQPPVLVAPLENKTLNCGEPIVFDTPEVADNCSPVTLTYTDLTTIDGCFEEHTRYWQASDAAGNAITITQTILVVDQIPPVIAGAPSDLTMKQDEWSLWLEQEGWKTMLPLAVDQCSDVQAVFLGYEATAPCIYILHWAAIDACGNSTPVSSSVTISDCLSSATQNVEVGSLQLFPNPASTSVTLKIGQPDVADKVRYRVMDAAGRVLSEQETAGTPDSVTIPVAELHPGVYFITLESGNRMYRGTFIKTDN